jgi:CxxC motif-containing protein (DUF1111 family)
MKKSNAHETAARWILLLLTALLAPALMLAGCVTPPPEPPAGSAAKDPGPRESGPSAGTAIAGLSALELSAFDVGKDDFVEVEGVDEGVGPTMNLDSCAGCHVHPAVGGTSPRVNPQVAFANRLGATNVVPPFISANGPVREARFVRNPDGTPDGGVHDLFTIAGRSDAPGCKLAQPDFAAQLAKRNVIFRIPTPLFGSGLIEQIPDSEIAKNLASDRATKSEYGIGGKPNIVMAFHTISGQPNKNGNDGTFGRFGWKAQNKSLLIFSGEAYNVEMGITSEAFPSERDDTPGCQFAATPNTVTKLGAKTVAEGISAIEKFAFFMRFLAPPTPSADAPGGAASIQRGKGHFGSAGCALCHTPSLRTGNTAVAALRNQTVNLYSDLLLHDMGTELADGVSQSQAGPSEFRTAPLWGLGQRLFFLHDGRTNDLRAAIQAHRSRGSEANVVIDNYYRLPEAAKQDLFNFLRSL